MTWLLFLAAAGVIVIAGRHLARYGDVLGEKSGMGRSWIGVVLLAATTSLPELVTGFGATAVTPLPDIAVGDVLGSCMFNLLILSLMDAVQPEPLSARAHQGHALSMGFGLLLIGVAGMAFLGGAALPSMFGIGLATPLLIGLYFVAMRVIFRHEQRRLAKEAQELAEVMQYSEITLRRAVVRYSAAAIFVVGAALWLPPLGATLARETGLGEAFVGSLFIAITTSLPEIVVSLAAVRMGALDLGIGNVLQAQLAIPLQFEDWDRSAQHKEGDLTISKYPAYPIWVSTRDMARIGYLMLREGHWNGRQLISRDWARRIVSVVTPVQEMNPVRRRDGYFGYGYMWWVWDGPKAVGPFKGAYSAVGAVGQWITVLPSVNLVVAHKTHNVYGRSTRTESWQRILELLLEARGVKMAGPYPWAPRATP